MLSIHKVGTCLSKSMFAVDLTRDSSPVDEPGTIVSCFYCCGA